jgi:thioredoxin-like negative regulator of GroEL
MIGLSLDTDLAAAKRFVAEKKLNWPQARIENPRKNPITQRFGVRGIPALFLLGPDGKIVARSLRGKRITSTVERFLSSSQH